jgi:hypothetical protein
VTEVGEYVAFVDGDSGGRKEAAVLGLGDERTYDRDSGRVGGDGVVDGPVREEGQWVEPATDPARGRERYDASEWTHKIISEAR